MERIVALNEHMAILAKRQRRARPLILRGSGVRRCIPGAQLPLPLAALLEVLAVGRVFLEIAWLPIDDPQTQGRVT